MAYIPKNKYEVLYTNGKEYRLLTSPQEYVGKYLKLANGKYFAGEDPQNIIGELIPLTVNYGNNIVNHPNNKLYSKLQPQIVGKIGKYQSIPFETPLPTPLDYNRGSFKRYFTIQLNTFEIKEISKETYKTFKSGKYDNTLYDVMVINWSLKENNAEINTKNLRYLESKVPGLSKLFPDKGQYGLQNGVINLRGGGNKRLYPNGEFIPSSLPAAYQLGNTDPQGSKVNERVPSYQHCKNCALFQNGKCNKWNAPVKNQYWCAVWESRVGN